MPEQRQVWKTPEALATKLFVILSPRASCHGSLPFHASNLSILQTTTTHQRLPENLQRWDCKRRLNQQKCLIRAKQPFNVLNIPVYMQFSVQVVCKGQCMSFKGIEWLINLKGLINIMHNQPTRMKIGFRVWLWHEQKMVPRPNSTANWALELSKQVLTCSSFKKTEIC